MAQIGSLTTRKLAEILRAEEVGVSSALAALCEQQNVTLPAISPHQIIAQNVASELSERSTTNKYPLVYVYCNKVVNQLREKFRTFSGGAHMVVEARVSNDRLEEMETNMQFCVDAITHVLDNKRGDWGGGVFYGGEYEVVFGGVKHGGRNFIQSAKVSFVLEISTD